MDYKDFFKHLFEAKKPNGDEGDDWVRPGSDLEPGMKIGGTNFPHGWGYPNYRPKHNDDEDFEETAQLDHIVDVPYEHSDQDSKKRTGVLYKYIKDKMPEFYQKFKSYIDSLFAKYKDYSTIHDLLISFIDLAKTEPSHKNVPNELKNINITDQDIENVKKIHDTYHKLYNLIHHRDDPQNELNYPLYVSLYDITRVLGGYEEGGWWYDKYQLIKSIQIRTPSKLLPTAEELYGTIDRTLDGKPRILVEKESGSQEEEEPPQWS